MNLAPHPNGTRLTRLDVLICGYLTLPLLMFCAWFQWPVAVVLALLTSYGLTQALRGAQWQHFDVSRPALAVLVAISLAWTALAGIGHFFFANLDWTIRDAVLRDLVETPWPPMYDAIGTTPVILRAPVGYYLPVAAVAAGLELPRPDILLYGWTACGFALVLCAATTLFPSRRERALCVALMLVFGGLDLLGFRLVNGELAALGAHIEGWAQFAQYSASSTLLFWVPNHALPAWMGAMLVLRHWRTCELARLTPLLLAATMLWSPLSAFGLVPFLLVGLPWRQTQTALVCLRSGLPFVGPALLAALYITMDTDTIARGMAIGQFANAHAFWTRYSLFCMLEFGIPALLLAGLHVVDLKVGVAIVVLMLLPLFYFGGSNDLVMRSSIPALTVLALATVRPLVAADGRLLRSLLGLVLAIGAVGALQEPARACLTPAWSPSGQTLAQVSFSDHAPFGLTQLPNNYVAQLNRPGLRWLMRQPQPVRPYASAASEPSR